MYHSQAVCLQGNFPPLGNKSFKNSTSSTNQHLGRVVICWRHFVDTTLFPMASFAVKSNNKDYKASLPSYWWTHV